MLTFSLLTSLSFEAHRDRVQALGLPAASPRVRNCRNCRNAKATIRESTFFPGSFFRWGGEHQWEAEERAEGGVSCWGGGGREHQCGGGGASRFQDRHEVALVGGGTGAGHRGFPTCRGLQFDFLHGVASGDPLSDSIVLWTRITHRFEPETTQVRWVVLDSKAPRWQALSSWPLRPRTSPSR